MKNEKSRFTCSKLIRIKYKKIDGKEEENMMMMQRNN